MSTIRVDNFGPSAGGTTYSARGIAKAWVNFNGTGTIAARDSENVSSLTDNGTGDYTVNFSNAFGAGDYAFPAQGYSSATNPAALRTNLSTFQAGSNRFLIVLLSGGIIDTDVVSASAHGDLA